MMRRVNWCLAFVLGTAATAAAQSPSVGDPPQNYIYFGRDRCRLDEAKFISNKGVIGAHLKYTWRELEPERDTYALDAISRDLDSLERHGKRLFIQLQDVSFDTSIVNVPDYLIEDPEFNGGAALHTDGYDERGPIVEGWVARRWARQCVSGSPG
jgi:hypothetical protein